MMDVEILKKARVYDVEKMRTILLINAEFNINNKLLSKEMMINAEMFKTIAKEQFSSRKWLNAIKAALNKWLTYDIMRKWKLVGAICLNNAKSCYNRISHNVASLAMQRQGAAKNVVKCKFSTLQKANHKVKTVFSSLSETYREEIHPSLQGMGQENGCGPASWAAISTPIINMIRTAGFGFQILSAVSIMVIAFICCAFVDDTDVVHTAEDVNTLGEEVMYKMQQVVDHWEGGIKATHRALVPNKSFWVLTNFK